MAMNLIGSVVNDGCGKLLRNGGDHFGTVLIVRHVHQVHQRQKHFSIIHGAHGSKDRVSIRPRAYKPNVPSVTMTTMAVARMMRNFQSSFMASSPFGSSRDRQGTTG